MSDFFQIFMSRNTEILIETNYWLGIYVPHILKDSGRLMDTMKIREAELFCPIQLILVWAISWFSKQLEFDSYSVLV